jgi:hypothetical protein
MFPTTVWTTIRLAGEEDQSALQDFATRYRAPVLSFIHRQGYQGSDAEDLVQDVFVRVLQGGVLAKADRDRGRFRSLLLAVTKYVILDKRRKRKTETPLPDLEPAQRDPEFDESWALHLTERAMTQLRVSGSPYYDVLEAHLTGQTVDRNKLWIARKKLATLIRREVAHTCATMTDFEEELAYLARYLRPREKSVRHAGEGGEEAEGSQDSD